MMLKNVVPKKLDAPYTKGIAEKVPVEGGGNDGPNSGGMIIWATAR
ncbi:hypothetical protein LF934_10115 [Dickeya dadantii]|nr:hypothetical protein [Dickeya dadantii]MCA7012998.1 hypothetical protein [Dickeya dadantii]